MTLRLAKLQNLLWRCSFAQTAKFAVSVYSRVIQRMQAWLEEPPILTTVSPVYVKIKIYAKYWFNVISQISSCAGIK